MRTKRKCKVYKTHDAIIMKLHLCKPWHQLYIDRNAKRKTLLVFVCLFRHVITSDTQHLSEKQNVLDGAKSSTTVGMCKTMRLRSVRIKTRNIPLNLTTNSWLSNQSDDCPNKLHKTSPRKPQRVCLSSSLPGETTCTHPNNSCSRATAKKLPWIIPIAFIKHASKQT